MAYTRAEELAMMLQQLIPGADQLGPVLRHVTKRREGAGESVPTQTESDIASRPANTPLPIQAPVRPPSPYADLAKRAMDLASKRYAEAEKAREKQLEYLMAEPERRKLTPLDLALVMLPALFGGSGGAAFASGAAAGLVQSDQERMRREAERNARLSQFFGIEAQQAGAEAFQREQTGLELLGRQFGYEHQVYESDVNNLKAFAAENRELAMSIAPFDPEEAKKRLGLADEALRAIGLPGYGDVGKLIDIIAQQAENKQQLEARDKLNQMMEPWVRSILEGKVSTTDLPHAIQGIALLLSNLPGDMRSVLGEEYLNSLSSFVSGIIESRLQKELDDKINLTQDAMQKQIREVVTQKWHQLKPQDRMNAAYTYLTAFEDYDAILEAQETTLVKARKGETNAEKAKEMDSQIAEIRTQRRKLAAARTSIATLAAAPTYDDAMLRLKEAEVQATLEGSSAVLKAALVSANRSLWDRKNEAEHLLTALTRARDALVELAIRRGDEESVTAEEMRQILRTYGIPAEQFEKVFAGIPWDKVSYQQFSQLLNSMLQATASTLEDINQQINGFLSFLGGAPLPQSVMTTPQYGPPEPAGTQAPPPAGNQAPAPAGTNRGGSRFIRDSEATGRATTRGYVRPISTSHEVTSYVKVRPGVDVANLTPEVKSLVSELGRAFPKKITVTSGKRSRSSYSTSRHPKGDAVDIVLSDWRDAGKVVDWLKTYGPDYQINQIIWKDDNWRWEGGRWTKGKPVSGHDDHIHIGRNPAFFSAPRI